ncbi:MAG: 2-hydroxyglutaryl-CoA dehydratase [Lachnospiraceae bacterium]|nr:2-hydroxyglutaryl-CoA dehydratase [Lachnospiraceae bacterium]MCI9184673.1 2-hydroxyglutaryl-CoA dehydratase [Lachnospiraceae bacterium]
MKVGLDVGSTTIKSIVLDDLGKIVYSAYERHFSQITAKTAEALAKVKAAFSKDTPFSLVISGSAGMGMAESCQVDFVQEVYATKVAAEKNAPNTDVVIELGGEDAKIIFLQGAMEARMNGSCAGGTGAFIDQMATLLGITPDDMNDYAKESTKLYTIASRCGVFAKSDIQPLINQGADKKDISASIFSAVVNQTIGGLAQGRAIKGNVLYLGGPLTFMSELRKSFDEALSLKGTCPENSLYFVALGAALCASKPVDLDQVMEALSRYEAVNEFNTLPALFKDEEEYRQFCRRHEKADVAYGTLEGYGGKAFVGIDAGSTTVKAVVIGEGKEILDSTYLSNSGNPVPIVRQYLSSVYERCPGIQIAGSCVTGYGEDIIKNAFSVDHGLVETMAHLKAAQEFMPDVEFIIDIGGQDMKCFKIHNSAIDNIYLNEACSSGCGSFLQTFAGALGFSAEEFSRMGLFSKNAVDLGSRCTVFMNSSVKQAQKDGVSTEDISAGLSISVVKNAIYKVIRPASMDELGKRIVVQGGTFLNDAVLRAFERELGFHVVRPVIAGLMGAYGCALHAMEWEKLSGGRGKSSIITQEELKGFAHQVKNVHCGRCSNNCLLSVNTFSGSRKYIAGNKCERPVTKQSTDSNHNIYKYKQELLSRYVSAKGRRKETIGLPLGLNLYEMVPFWHRFFTELGFGVQVSPFSNRELYLSGQLSIPSDTVCFPAKMLHGHVEYLLEKQVDAIFYPCMSFNFDEGLGDNNYNCPVVAYYPEVIAANMKFDKKTVLINDYVGPHKRKFFPQKMVELLSQYFGGIDIRQVKRASGLAFREREVFLRKIRGKAKQIVAEARKEGRRIIVLAGRPYHVDPEINHGIDMLINGFGVSVISEDSVSQNVAKFPVRVLNQWMYHARLYAAAKYVCTQEDMDLVQLVSFGCGLDAITTDEVRSIIEKGGKIYTQIKIDEITNLGAVKVRLRSLLAALDRQKELNRA